MRLERNLKRITSTLSLKEQLYGNTKKWVTWWYSGIYKNPRADSVPHVLVAFRELSDTGELSEQSYFRRVPLTALGQLRVGSIWLEGECLQEVVYDTECFDVNFSQDGWQLNSFQFASQHESHPPFPREIYPLHYERDRNWLIDFQIGTEGTLIVPCLEFFSRCYGRSHELKRVLATYPWHGTNGGTDNRLYAPLDQPREDGKWKVKLKKRLVNGDVVFLAHAKYDRYTEVCAKQIYAQIETAHDPKGKFPTFIKVLPWFRGEARLKVRGIWFNDKKSFLALQVLGCSDPAGVLIERNRENRNNANRPADPNNPGSAWSGAPDRTIVRPPEIIDLTDELEPDHGAGPVEIQDPDFEVLGPPRLVVDYRDDQAKNSGGLKTLGTDTDTFSTGEPNGDGKGVGYASIHARPVLESQGTLRDMWNALLEYHRRFPKLITKVEWFTFEDRYQTTVEPKLIGIREFSKEELLSPFPEEVTTSIRTWPYMDAVTKSEMRGVLVARVKIGDTHFHILEIQRRPRKKKEDGIVKDSEESFQGFIFTIKNEEEVEEYLHDFLSDVRYVKGVVQHLVNSCPGKAASFNHSKADNPNFPCESAIRNALERKMGISLP